MLFTSTNLAFLAGAASLASALPASHVRRATGSSSKAFNLQSSNNVVAYWGNGPPQVKLTPLSDVCADANLDMVVLTFAGYANNQWTLAGNKPAADDIKKCQSAGKKVLMSIGGETGSIQWNSTDQATKAADAAFNEYLTDKGSLKVALDGIDLDIENKAPKYWKEFAQELKKKMNKSQLLSAAPQCPSPDASLPMDVLASCDLVFVQFYNNPGCQHKSPGFAKSAQGWSKSLKDSKFYVAALGDPNSGNSTAYLDADALSKEISQVKGMGLKNFGGYAFWDASSATQNKHLQAAARKALGAAGSAQPSGGAMSTGVATHRSHPGGTTATAAVPTSTVDSSAATTTDDSSAATATDDSSAATATDDSSAATATDDSSDATITAKATKTRSAQLDQTMVAGGPTLSAAADAAAVAVTSVPAWQTMRW